jgi:imidazolonepropionase-like amidohydrolase
MIPLRSCNMDTNMTGDKGKAEEMSASAKTNSNGLVSSGSGFIALKNCTLIDGTGSAPIENGVIIVKDSRIVKAGDTGNVVIPEGCRVIGLNGRVVLPGLINAHVHNAYNEDTLQHWLAAGITTVRDLAPRDKSTFVSTGKELNKDIKNSRIVIATPIISPPGGYGRGISVESPVDARKKVLELIEKGADIIKIAIEDDCQGRRWPKLSADNVRSIVEAAHSKNRKVSAHITHSRNLHTAVEYGVDDIAHMVVEPLGESIISKMIEKDIYWVPTLELWKGVSKIHGLNYDRIAVDNLSKFYAAGGKIALGTDFCGYSFTFDNGLPVTEICLMQEAGMSNMDIITAATKNAAYVCGMGNELGTIEEGKIADLLVVNGNPLENMDTLKEPFMVIHNGEIVLNQE